MVTPGRIYRYISFQYEKLLLSNSENVIPKLVEINVFFNFLVVDVDIRVFEMKHVPVH
jgi:hypothetical protein